MANEEDLYERINAALLENTLAIKNNTEASNTRMGNVNSMIENLIKIVNITITGYQGYKDESDDLIKANVLLTKNNAALIAQLGESEKEKKEYWDALQKERERFDALLKQVQGTATGAPYVSIANK